MASLTLPDLSGVAAGLSDQKERRRIVEYLYQLTEQLRYVLGNLDGENLSAPFLTQITDNSEITQIRQTLTDAQSGMRSLRRQTAEGFAQSAQRMDAMGNQVQSLSAQTAEGFEQSVQRLDAMGKQVESLADQTAEGFSQTVRRDGILSAINQSAEEIRIDASKVALTGESIRLEGCTTINGAFRVDEEGCMHASSGSSIGDLVVGQDDVSGSFLAYYAVTGTPGIGNSEFCIAPKLGRVVLSRTNNCFLSRDEIRLGDLFSVGRYTLQAPLKGVTAKPKVPTLQLMGSELVLQSYKVNPGSGEQAGAFLSSPNSILGIYSGSIVSIMTGSAETPGQYLDLGLTAKDLFGESKILDRIYMDPSMIQYTAPEHHFYGYVYFHNGHG